MARAMQWFSIVDEGDRSLASAAQFEADLLTGLSLDLTKGATITRVLLDIVIAPDTVSQITHTSYGLVMVNDDQFSAGAVPEADANADRADWLLRARSRNTAAAISDSSQLWVRSYDLHSQRVLRSEKQTLALVLDQSSGGGVVFYWMSRVLVKFR